MLLVRVRANYKERVCLSCSSSYVHVHKLHKIESVFRLESNKMSRQVKSRNGGVFTLVCLRDLKVDESYDFADMSFDRTLIAVGKH